MLIHLRWLFKFFSFKNASPANGLTGEQEYFFSELLVSIKNGNGGGAVPPLPRGAVVITAAMIGRVASGAMG
jgi:hypothetical protein